MLKRFASARSSCMDRDQKCDYCKRCSTVVTGHGDWAGVHNQGELMDDVVHFY